MFYKVFNTKFWPQYFAAFTASLTIFGTGIHYGCPGPSLPRLLGGELPFNVSNEEASYITISGPVGDILGIIVSAVLGDMIGRKSTLMISCVPQIISFFLIYVSYYEKSLLYLARFIGGISEGAVFTLILVYATEIAEPTIRGFIGTYSGIMFTFGLLVVYCIGSFISLQTASLIYAVIPIVSLLLMIKMPETPYYFLMRDKVESARKSLVFLRNKEDIEDELQSIKNDVKRQLQGNHTFLSLYTDRTNRTSCIIIFGLRFFQQFSGYYAFITYTQVFLGKSHERVSKETVSILLIVTQAIASIVASCVVDKVGRKPLFVICCAGNSVVLLIEAIYFTLEEFTSVDVTNFTWIPPIGLVLAIFLIGLGYINLVILILGELFPVGIKKKALPVVGISYALSMFISAKFYQYTADNFGEAIPFYSFAVSQFLGVFFCWKYLPETKNKTLEEIQLKISRRHRNKNKESTKC